MLLVSAASKISTVSRAVEWQLEQQSSFWVGCSMCRASRDGISRKGPAHARPTSFCDNSKSFFPFSASPTSSDTSFSKEPELPFQLQYTPERSMLGSLTTCRQYL